MLEKLLVGVRTLVRKALAEHASPGKIALSVAVGVFCSSTPLIGFHIWLALGLATLFRLNRLWAAVGSHASFGVWPLFVFVEIEVAHRMRLGTWAPISAPEAVARGREMLLDWVLGTFLVGGAYAALLGLLAHAIARRLPLPALPPPVPVDRGVTSSTPDEPRPASSESPPSAPPSPTP